MTLGPLRVAAVQAVSIAGDVEANVAAAACWVERAAAEGASLVVLPELFLPGYDPETLRTRRDCDVTPQDPRLAPLRRVAASAAVTVMVGAAVSQADGGRTLSLLCVDASGRVSVPYSKQHLWDAERGIFSAGVEGATATLGEWPLGLGICYDGCFPEHARAAADDGALVYVCPSAYVVGSEHRRDLYYAARAIDNGVYVVFAGLVGRCGSLDFSGGTAIYDPQGRSVARVRPPQGDEVAAPPDKGSEGMTVDEPGLDQGSEGMTVHEPGQNQVVEGLTVHESCQNQVVEGMAIADLLPEEVAEARRINPYERDRPPTLGPRTWTHLSQG